MPVSFVGSYAGTHAVTGSYQRIAFTNLRDAAGATPTVQAGDLVVVAVENALTVSNTSLVAFSSQQSSLYTAAHSADYQNDSNDSNFQVSYKFMGATPDTSVDIPPTSASTGGLAYVIYVFRGTGGLDVPAVVTGGTNTGVANAPAITPVTAGSWIVAFGGAAVAAGAVFTNPAGMSTTTNHFRSATITTTTNDANIAGAIYTGWTSGAYDPAAFGGSTTTNTGSWSAVTIALKPGAAPRSFSITGVQNNTRFPSITTGNRADPANQNFTVTLNAATAPDGTNTAHLYTENTSTNAVHGWYANNQNTLQFLVGETYRLQTYVKPNGRDRIILEATNDFSLGRVQVQFNLTTQSVVSTTYTGSQLTVSSSGLEALANGWTRVWVDVTPAGAFPNNNKQKVYGSIYLCDSAGSISYTGNGTSGIYAWGTAFTLYPEFTITKTAQLIYRGAKSRSLVYLGTKTDAQIYFGAKQLF